MRGNHRPPAPREKFVRLGRRKFRRRARRGIPDRGRDLIEGGGADRDHLLAAGLAVGAFADGPPDGVAIGAGAGGGGEPAAPVQILLQPPGRGGAADDLLEPAVRDNPVQPVAVAPVRSRTSTLFRMRSDSQVPDDRKTANVDQTTSWLLSRCVWPRRK